MNIKIIAENQQKNFSDILRKYCEIYNSNSDVTKLKENKDEIIACRKCGKEYNHKERIYCFGMAEDKVSTKTTYSDCPYCNSINLRGGLK